MWIPLTVRCEGRVRNLHVQATAESRVRDLAESIGRHLGKPAPLRLASIQGPLSPNDYLQDAGVQPGTTLDVLDGHPPTGSTQSATRRELRVTAGPEAGLIVPLPENGSLRIGRGAENDIVLSDGNVSTRHALLELTPDSVVLRDLGSKNHTAVDGAIVNEIALRPGMRIQIGADRLTLFDRVGHEAVKANVDAQFRLYRRQRFLVRATPDSLSAPKPPDKTPKAPMTIGLTALTGLVGGVIAYLAFNSPLFLLLSAVSFLLGLASSGLTALKHKRTNAKNQREFEAAMVAHEGEVRARLAAERARRLADLPDPAEVFTIAMTPEERLWERTPADDDFLRLRIGMADLDSQLTINHPDGSQTHRTMLDVPLDAFMATAGTVGVRGPRENAHALARWLVIQAVVQSGPADVRVAVLCRPGDRTAATAWDFVRWLPHARAGGEALAFVGADETSLTARVEQFAEIVSQRQQASVHSYGQQTRAHRPHWLVVVDDLRESEAPKLADILSGGPDVGVSIIAISQMPQRCPIEVTFTDPAHATVRRAGSPPLADVLVDQINVRVAERIARAIAPLHDPQLQTGTTGLPGQVSLLDLLPVSSLDPAALKEAWARTPRQTRVVVGQTGAEALHIDLVANGPHALVAGATGSGKSAMLQTVVASLAVANRPDELGFILVDFKGGAAFRRFEELPHVLGTVTNLDGHAVMRVLRSLEGELRRRQRYLAAAGVDSLANYHKAADEHRLPQDCPVHLPRVFVVIDEFAMLKEEAPAEVLDVLVHIATLGRSLGVHLVIGTQMPQGVVPPQMRANVNLKVAFRIEANHSQDVLGVADAEHLAGSGRGYVKRGDDGELILFQSAYIGGSSRRQLGSAVSLVEIPFARLGYLPADERGGASDIDVLVAAVRDAAKLSGVQRVPAPWLDDLPSVLTLSSVPPIAPGADLVLRFGQEDQPELRDQPAATWNLTRGTHLLVGGKPRSGRTTLLRTLAASIATFPTDRVHLYVMDCGGALGDLASLPHCGAVVTSDEIERGARLLDRLEGMLTVRENGQHSPTRTHTVLFIDGWQEWVETFGAVDNGALLNQLMRLANRGSASGLHIAVTGDSSLLTAVGPSKRLLESAEDRLVLPFNPDDYRWLGIPVTAVPNNPDAGMAVRQTAPHRTIRVAVVGDSPDSAAQASALRAIAATVPAIEGTLPARVDALPRSIRLAEARLKPEVGTRPDSGLYLGVGGDDLHQVGIDFEVDGPGIYVTGQGRAERGNALLVIAVDLLSRGIPVVAVAPARGSALYALRDSALLVKEPNSRRVMELALAAFDPPFVVLVDDANQLERGEADPVLREWLARPEQPWTGMVVGSALDDLAGPHSSSFLTELGRSGTGLILGPRTARTQLFSTFVKIPPAYVAGEPAGRGVLVRRSGVEPIQVPTVGEADLATLPSLAYGLPALLQQAAEKAGPTSTIEQLRAVIRELRGRG